MQTYLKSFLGKDERNLKGKTFKNRATFTI